MRPDRSIWTYVADPVTVVSPAHGDTCFNSASGESWVWDDTFSVWNPFRLTNTAGTGTAGYAISGGSFGAAYVSVDRILFSTEVVSSLTGFLSVGRVTGSGYSSYSAGYCAGGRSQPAGTTYTNIDKLTFSGESLSLLASGITQARCSAPHFDSFVAGYMVTGDTTGAGIIMSSRADKLVFVSETCTSITSTLSTWKTNKDGDPRSLTVGYTGGGWDGAIVTNTVSKMPFSTETWASVVSTLTVANQGQGVAWTAVNGYWLGGSNNVVDRIVYTTDVITNIGVTLPNGAASPASSQGHQKAYIMGGGYISTIDTFRFQDETTSSIAATLTVVRGGAAGVQNMN